MEDDEVGQGLGPCFTWQAIKADPTKLTVSAPCLLNYFYLFSPYLNKKIDQAQGIKKVGLTPHYTFLLGFQLKRRSAKRCNIAGP